MYRPSEPGRHGDYTVAVRQLKNGRWQADVVVGRRWDGTLDRRTECHDTKAKARKAETRLLLEKERARGRVTGRISLADYVEDVYWPQKEGLRANTRQGYERDLRRRILPALGQMDVERIDKPAIQRMISACPTRKVATNARETLSSVLGTAVELGMIPVNPAGFRYTYPAEGGVDPEAGGEWITTFDEHRRLLDFLRETRPGSVEERIAVIGLCEGLRKGEVLALQWGDVDLDRRELSVRHTYTQGKGGSHLTEPKNRNARRTIPLRAYAAERMAAWGPGEGSVVPGRGGGLMSPVTAGKRIRNLVAGTYADGAPLPRVTMASMRHSFATACVNEGMEVSKLSLIMGHADIKTTMRYYVRQKLRDLHRAVDEMDECE